MKKFLFFITIFTLISCGSRRSVDDLPGISVSISPYKMIVDVIGGGDFNVNVMVPPGSSPHYYEPFPEQITNLQQSVAYIANGYLDFENVWLDRFLGINEGMPLLTLADEIELLELYHSHPDSGVNVEDDEHMQDSGEIGVDPHFWLSPARGIVIAEEIKDFLGMLNPDRLNVYQENYEKLLIDLKKLDVKADSLFSLAEKDTFIIYHPNLSYIADDYDLHEMAIEKDGKEPSPAWMVELVDFAEREGIKTIFIQKEYDKRYAGTIASDIGAKVVVLDPLSEDWLGNMDSIIEELYKSFIE